MSAAEGVANIIDQFVETDDEKQPAENIKAKMMMQPSLTQIELNKIDAGQRSADTINGLKFIFRHSQIACSPIFPYFPKSVSKH